MLSVQIVHRRSISNLHCSCRSAWIAFAPNRCLLTLSRSVCIHILSTCDTFPIV